MSKSKTNRKVRNMKPSMALKLLTNEDTDDMVKARILVTNFILQRREGEGFIPDNMLYILADLNQNAQSFHFSTTTSTTELWLMFEKSTNQLYAWLHGLVMTLLIKNEKLQNKINLPDYYKAEDIRKSITLVACYWQGRRYALNMMDEIFDVPASFGVANTVNLINWPIDVCNNAINLYAPDLKKIHLDLYKPSNMQRKEFKDSLLSDIGQYPPALSNNADRILSERTYDRWNQT